MVFIFRSAYPEPHAPIPSLTATLSARKPTTLVCKNHGKATKNQWTIDNKISRGATNKATTFSPEVRRFGCGEAGRRSGKPCVAGCADTGAILARATVRRRRSESGSRHGARRGNCAKPLRGGISAVGISATNRLVAQQVGKHVPAAPTPTPMRQVKRL